MHSAIIRAFLIAAAMISPASAAETEGTAAATTAAATPISNAERFPTPSPLPEGPALPGDETRDCASLYAESKYRLAENDKINHETLNKTYVKGAKTQALEAAGQLGGMISVLGGLISMGSMMGQMASNKEDGERNYGELNRRSDWALNRMVYVSDMYRNRCIKGAK